jgi:hypothetical protein
MARDLMQLPLPSSWRWSLFLVTPNTNLLIQIEMSSIPNSFHLSHDGIEGTVPRKVAICTSYLLFSLAHKNGRESRKSRRIGPKSYLDQDDDGMQQFWIWRIYIMILKKSCLLRVGFTSFFVVELVHNRPVVAGSVVTRLVIYLWLIGWLVVVELVRY